MKLVIALLAPLLLATASASAAEMDLPANGWTSWEVPAVADAPAWCCMNGNRPAAATKPCNLDSRNDGYISDGETKTDTVRIYARFNDGALERLRALSADCPVRAGSEIRTASVTGQASAEWIAKLLDQKEPGKHLRNDALAALAVHREPVAYEALATFARDGKQFDQRKDAVFWLALLRGREGAEATTSVMFRDPDPRMREHAAFAITQSKSKRIAEDLTRLATTDRDRKVRGQAWFWLSQTKSPQTEQAITAALGAEPDRHVRDQAIFALSQLPEERAARALIAVAENKALDRHDRRQAIFWLGQANSEASLAYLDKVLGTASR